MITINPTKLVRNANTRGEFIFRGGLALQAELGTQNVRQFGRFLRTPQGARFVAQQALLQIANPSRKELEIKKGQPEVKTSPYKTTQLYNPGAPILAKALSQEFTALKPPRHIDQDGFSTLNDTIGSVKKGIKNINDNIDNFVDRVYGIKRGGTENSPVTYFSNNKGEQYSLQVSYGGVPNELSKTGTDRKTDLPTDFIKFRIRDAVNGRYIIFPALLSGGITDNSSAEYSPISYIGRPDKIYVYGGYTRTINFTVNIVSLRQTDIPIVWEKINYAKGLTLPQYKPFFARQDGDSMSDKRPVAPLVYLTLGDLFNNTPGYFTSVNMSIPENTTWELTDGEQVPHLCSLAFDFTYIGKQVPTMTSKHYDNISKKFQFKGDN